jgi:hypothetical protein
MERMMELEEIVAAIKPEALASFALANAAKVQHSQHEHPQTDSVREADYHGHHIVIHTTYRIEVDGVPITGHVGVENDGRVHYHVVPNVTFPSAVTLVKRLIDLFPEDFPAHPETEHTHPGHTHTEHSHHG